MIKEIVKEIAGHYNKKVVFDTVEEMTKETRAFKLGEDVIGDCRFIILARINEHEDHVTVINLRVMTIQEDEFAEINNGGKYVFI